MTIRFGIIGCGAIGRWHGKAIQNTKGAQLMGAADAFPDSALRFAGEFNTKAFHTVEEMLQSADIDAVCICTPSGHHVDMAIQAASAGKHILIEKPMALTVEDCDRIIEAVQKSGVKAGVIFQSRFTHTAQLLKKLVQEGKLGKIISADVIMRYYRSPEYYAAGGWRGTWAMDGGGALMNQGIHSVDLLQYVVGSVHSVMAEARTLYHQIEVEDTVCAVAQFECGALGLIQATTAVQPGYPRLLTICGTAGSVSISDENFVSWDIPDCPPPHDVQIGYQVKNQGFSDPMAISTIGHEMQIADMVSAIENDHQPMIPVTEGRKSIEIIRAIYESSQQGKRILL